MIESKNKDIEIKRKEQKMLERQTKIIGYKVKAMKEYSKYLTSVMEAHQDEYSEIADIKSRHETLMQSNKELEEYQSRIDAELEYEKEVTTEQRLKMAMEIMTLNNDYAMQQVQFEKIEDQKKLIKTEEETNHQKKLGKTSELGMMFMAINNLYEKCTTGRPGNPQYTVAGNSDPKNYERGSARTQYAEKQIQIVQQYMQDFTSIIADYKEEKKKEKLKPLKA